MGKLAQKSYWLNFFNVSSFLIIENQKLGTVAKNRFLVTKERNMILFT